jgi:hypothetical protein
MYKFEKNGEWGEFLVVETKNLGKIIEYIKRNNLTKLWISKEHGYKHKNISFLRDISAQIEGLIIIDGDIRLDGIEELVNLRMLSLSDKTNFHLDLSKYKRMCRCSLIWNKNISNISSCKKMEDLTLRKVSKAEFLAESISELRELKELALMECKMADLSFLSKLSMLHALEIYYDSNLKDITSIKYCQKLNKLILDHCRNISSYDILGQLKNLSFLTISDSAEIPALDFIKPLKKLKHFGFVGTNVIDGDLSPCLKIEHVGFNNRKHYSHKYEEFAKNK